MSFWKPGSSIAQYDRGRESDVEGVSYIIHNPHDKMSLSSQKRALPIFKHRLNLLYAVETYNTVIIVGATGSGKSTQTPQYLFEAGWTSGNRCIACTQPRRIGVISLATRVAREMGCDLGETVGYSIQFNHNVNLSTKIKYMTDGHLIRETMADPLLSRYSVIMLDEAHERNLQTDILLGLLKKIRKKRPELKIIISSATLDAETFRKFFRQRGILNDAIIFGIDGRQFPVGIQYLESPVPNYIEKSIRTVLDINKYERAGDILVFLPGQEEVDAVCKGIKNQWNGPTREIDNIWVVPLYSKLSYKLQMKIFQRAPTKTRKIVIATNIAETSITIDGVSFVVDSGFVKLPFYDPISGMDTLIVQPISKASAAQRAGRAGRVKSGKCFRLYTEDSFLSLTTHTVPEMCRTDLTWSVLQLKALGVDDIVHFDFVSPPPAESLIRALELLYSLGCLDDACALTNPIGLTLAEFPVEPRLGKMLFTSLDMNCSEEILTIAAMVSVKTPFQQLGRSKEAKTLMEDSIQELSHADGDHITHLNVFNEWVHVGGKTEAWCNEHSISYKTMIRANEVRSQLRGYLKRLAPKGVTIQSCDGNSETIRQCVTAGFFSNAARLSSNGLYRTLKDSRTVSIHPSSVLYRRTRALPPYILYNDITLTSQEYIRDISIINPKWLVEMASHYYESQQKLRTAPKGYDQRPTKRQRGRSSKPASISSLLIGRFGDIMNP